MYKIVDFYVSMNLKKLNGFLMSEKEMTSKFKSQRPNDPKKLKKINTKFIEFCHEFAGFFFKSDGSALFTSR